MKRLLCRLGRHTTNPPIGREWWPTWRCVHCGVDLRTPPEQEAD